VTVEHTRGGPQLTAGFAPQSLMDCIHWHLADSALGGWIRRCRDPKCGAFFVAKNNKTLYCPNPLGIKGASRCMNRHKQQKRRDALKEKKEAKS
ncbi:MAG: hypothetical protein VYE73_06230, partial [Acidobacteriota bacterium]|nr:hypothetical protein [Acidobacteriota bacterium]